MYQCLNCAFDSFLQLEFNNWIKTEKTNCPENLHSESGIETLVECQSLCLQNNDCVGISFSPYWATHAASWCYLCKNYNTTHDVYYETYQRPGDVYSHKRHNWTGILSDYQLQNIACINISYIGSSCKCKDLIVNGNGNCQTNSTSATHHGERFCYVELPSKCMDLIDSSEKPGEKFSVEACSSGSCNTLSTIKIIPSY